MRTKYFCKGLVGVGALCLASCLTSTPDTQEKNSYIYAGKLTSEDYSAENLDTAVCFAVEMFIGWYDIPDYSYVVNTNTCEMGNVRVGNLRSVKKIDTLANIAKKLIQFDLFAKIDWKAPRNDSGWIAELTLTPESRNFEWSDFQVKINLGKSISVDTLKMPDRSIDYILKFTKLDN